MARKEKRRNTDEPRKIGKKCGQPTSRTRAGNRKKTRNPRRQRKESEAAAGNDKDEDKDYHPSEDAGDASSQDPTYEPSKKELKRADKEGDQ